MLPKEYVLNGSESEITCPYLNSRVLGYTCPLRYWFNGHSYKPLIQVRGSCSHRVRPESRGSKGEDTRKKGKLALKKGLPFCIFTAAKKRFKFSRKAKNPENDLEESRQVDEISVATPAVVEEKKEPPPQQQQQQQQQQQPPPQLQTQTSVTTKVDAKTSKLKSTKIEASKLRRRKMGTGIGPDLPGIEGATKTGAKAKPTRQQSSNNQSRQTEI